MIAKSIDGKALSIKLLNNLKTQINNIKHKINDKFQPALAIIQVGNRLDSNLYISNKFKAAEQVGINVKHFKFDSNSSQTLIQDKINELNGDSRVHGIIVQLPLQTTSETKLDTNKILNTVCWQKDVDGLTDINAGKLANGHLLSDLHVPCTPKACFELIKSTGCQIDGKNVTVIGRSRLIGSPLSNLLMWHDATVTTCHLKTQNIKEICSSADILVAAAGSAKLVKQDWIKNNAIVIDCGINEFDGKLCGDVDFENVRLRASHITPVPGGVGPMTVAMLLTNTFESALRSERIIRS